MNKSALKKFATEARKELLERVELQARKIGITADSIQNATVESSKAIYIGDKQLKDFEVIQRNKLIKRIEEIGFDRVMEETAYTWFNRFIALRFMEVNDYLPTKVRVLSSYNVDSAEPDMIKEALSLDLQLDKELVYELKMANKTDELFKYLIKVHCNDLNRYMPFMFETIEDYKEILFPEGLLGTDSFVRQMTNPDVIAERDWESVEIIGWLYQYYISEEKDEVFANLKKNIKISKEKLPAATQLFTPNWIVRYMVENSLGRIWMESYPDSSLKEQWKYYLDEAEQEDAVKKQLEEIRYKNVNPEEITFLDPCCGSGHILVYAFDVFYEMYLEKGYVENEIPQLILSKNLFGLDIDDRAVQLASFAVMMKARGKSRRVFRKEIKINILAIQESNWITDDLIDVISKNNEEIRYILKDFQTTFYDAKEYGSILDFKKINYESLSEFFKVYEKEDVDLLELVHKEVFIEKLPALINQIKVLLNNYDVVCTNPPYMGRSGMNTKLIHYLNENYPNTKSDLSTVMMEKSLNICKETGMVAMLNIPVWMFLQSYQTLRESIINNNTIINMLHLGRGVFGADFGTTAFVISKYHINDYIGSYRRLFKRDGSVDSIEQKEKWFYEKIGCFTVKQNIFYGIPGNPIAYWASENLIEDFKLGTIMSELIEPKVGLQTGDNNRFLRIWWEPNKFKIKYDNTSIEEAKSGGYKWVPYNKGGDRRQWYGNYDYVVNWESDGEEIKSFTDDKGKLRSRPQNTNYYFKEGITWSLITSGGFSIRYRKSGSIHDVSGMTAFEKANDVSNLKYILGLMSTKIANYIFKMLNPTINLQAGDFNNFPVIINERIRTDIEEIVDKNILISKDDWDDFETSWDFSVHPLLSMSTILIAEAYNKWLNKCDNRFNEIKSNEERLNQIFIELYGLQNELSSEIGEQDVTIRKADLERDIKSFISYAIGSSFGRYSLDEKGLIYAGGEFDSSRYKTFSADEDNILPILSGAYFEDDIVTKFVDFVRVTFSDETLEENLDFIADAIGRKKSETAREAIRRYFLNDFFKDHVQTYKKRPIYWLFTSGKEKAFNCLIYMHRYDETTLSRIRTDYLHEVQIRMDAEKKDLLSIIDGDYTTKEISDAKKALKSLDKKIDELKAYDELLHHMADKKIPIDLDDGVKHNYDLFKGLVAKI